MSFEQWAGMRATSTWSNTCQQLGERETQRRFVQQREFWWVTQHICTLFKRLCIETWLAVIGYHPIAACLHFCLALCSQTPPLVMKHAVHLCAVIVSIFNFHIPALSDFAILAPKVRVLVFRAAGFRVPVVVRGNLCFLSCLVLGDNSRSRRVSISVM